MPAKKTHKYIDKKFFFVYNLNHENLFFIVKEVFLYGFEGF